jgi:hypothetical protein
MLVTKICTNASLSFLPCLPPSTYLFSIMYMSEKNVKSETVAQAWRRGKGESERVWESRLCFFSSFFLLPADRKKDGRLFFEVEILRV